MERIKHCWCWLNGAMVMSLIISVILNLQVYRGKISMESPAATCQEIIDKINGDSLKIHQEQSMLDFQQTAVENKHKHK